MATKNRWRRFPPPILPASENVTKIIDQDFCPRFHRKSTPEKNPVSILSSLNRECAMRPTK